MLNEVILNLYAQDRILREKIVKYFENLTEDKKNEFRDKLLFLVYASNVSVKHLDNALENSGYRSTINYYNMLKSRRDIFRNNLFRIKNLEGKPLKQGIILLLELFKEAYKLKAVQCHKTEGECYHWWHRDLSNKKILKKIIVYNFGESFGKAEEITEKISKISEK